jgi:two-component system, sensor histidine kinase and response regulator
MQPLPADWSTQQLTEFSAFVSGFLNETDAARAAVERACEILEAEVGVLVVDDRVGPAVGFPFGRVPAERLLEVTQGLRSEIDVPGVGACRVLAVPLEDGIQGHILVARSGGEGFCQEETTLLRGMARILALSLNRLSVLEALRVSEERARRVIETAGESFVAVDLSGRVCDWNHQAELTFGFTAVEAIGRPARELFAPGAKSDADVLWRLLTLSQDGTPIRRETWGLHRDGRRFPVEVTAWSFVGADGRVYNAFVKDITGRKRARELQSQLAAIVQHSDDAIVGLDQNATITSWNPGAERLYGYSAEEAVGGTVAILTPWTAPDFRAPVLLDVARGNTMRDYETEIERKDGMRITVSVNASPIIDEKGKVVGISSVARDITDRKRSETELAAARDQAVEAARLKSEFLANMSHEIRTPMNAVIGMTQILLETDLTDEQRDYAQTVRTSGTAMLEIIDDILDFSKIEAGKMRLAAVELTVQAVVEEVAEMLAPRAHEKGLELTTLVDPTLGGLLRGDPGRLRQILLNLVGNAVKFTECGEVAVRVWMTGGTGTAQEDGTVEVCFEVADTGIGIPAEEADRLFDPFYQVDASASRRHGGTGLGLAISSRLVETMGGSIGVRSEPGQGSCFWFTARLGGVGTGIRPPAVQLDGLRVLVVDDSTAARETLLHQLAAWGADADAAADGEEALEALRSTNEPGVRYDVLIVDAQMSGLDGLGLLHALAGAEALLSAKVILLTPPGSRVDKDVAARLRVAACLPKPVRQSSLLDCLAGLTGARIGPIPALAVPTPADSRLAPVLVAEDNPVNQRVAMLMLKRLGYRARVVGNGAEALDALDRGDFSAVLMDCQMPGMDGYEATGQLRRREAMQPGRRMPVIAMTAGAMEGDRQRCLDAGMDDYIAKPVNLAALEGSLRRWVGDDAFAIVSLDQAAPEATG